MVRPSSDIWQLFDIVKTDKKSKAVCKFCCFKYAFPNATRMTNHILNQCSKCPLEIKQKYGNEIQSSSKSSTSEEKESNKDILLEALEDTLQLAKRTRHQCHHLANLHYSKTQES
ncbi:unnamed protein product [Acanthoscelides obtectus]|uniref:BED-type domain-containing protein n=1 Tax=Acanthoscelides obtectus TaxID=200917 RepID=A0A9P0PGJ1_ACAOB|nr:unnamed protein product [Acanthoscelides obtectus]CAK1660205.1 hypothetical protein AOBTE_LOCUS21906 [Acanthoscelides obtectus]